MENHELLPISRNAEIFMNNRFGPIQRTHFVLGRTLGPLKLSRDKNRPSKTVPGQDTDQPKLSEYQKTDSTGSFILGQSVLIGSFLVPGQFWRVCLCLGIVLDGWVFAPGQF